MQGLSVSAATTRATNVGSFRVLGRRCREINLAAETRDTVRDGERERDGGGGGAERDRGETDRQTDTDRQTEQPFAFTRVME